MIFSSQIHPLFGKALPELCLFVLFFLFYRDSSHHPNSNLGFPLAHLWLSKGLRLLAQSSAFPLLFPVVLVILQGYLFCVTNRVAMIPTWWWSYYFFSPTPWAPPCRAPFLLCLFCVADDQTFSAPLPTVLLLVFTLHLTSLMSPQAWEFSLYLPLASLCLSSFPSCIFLVYPVPCT